MNHKPFVPTEEELVSLGFKPNNSGYMAYWKFHEARIQFVPCSDDYFEFQSENDLQFALYPKSLEELRLLISMMEP